jgi:AhpD family alkylhydroperoxidase
VADDPHVIPMMDVQDVPDGARKIFEMADERGAPDAGLLRILAHNEEALERFTTFWWAVFDGGTIDITLKELLRVSLADIYGCGYCGTVRSLRATEAGLTEDRIQLACMSPDDPSFSDRERLVLEWGRRLAEDPHSIDQEFSDRLKEHFTYSELIELGCLGALCVGFDSLLPTWGIGAHTCQVPVSDEAEAKQAVRR